MFREGTERLIVFGLGAERFAVPLSAVDEVIDMPSLQRIPDSPAGILGVASLRGTLVTVLDPTATLNVAAGLSRAALLFTRGGKQVALAVDDVHDAILVDRTDLMPAPRAGTDGMLAGLLRRGGDLIAVVDAHALLEAATVASEGVGQGDIR